MLRPARADMNGRAVERDQSEGRIVINHGFVSVRAWKDAIDFRNAVGFKAERPGELREAISQALNAEGPAIVDCVVPADELPNLPHLELETMGNFAKAKAKEAILEVTGG
jgi:hypothetical protein